MAKAKRQKKRKRPWYTTSEPLSLVGTVPPAEAVGEAGRYAGLTVLVRWIPAFRQHRRGRDKAHLAKVLLVVSGIGLAILTATIPGIVLGGCVVASAFVLPVPAWRKSLWIKKIEAFGGGRTRAVSQPATIEWNGRKISVRVGGRVVRSLRPFEVGLPPVVGVEGGRATLGLLPREEGVGAPIWAQAEGSLPGEAVPLGSLDGAAIEEPVELSLSEWERLWETMTDPRHGAEAAGG